MNAPIRPPSPENASPQQIFQAILATDFRSFVEYVFGLLRPGTPFKPNWHIDAMAHKVSQVAIGDVKRLIITVPPRHLKSIIASVALAMEELVAELGAAFAQSFESRLSHVPTMRSTWHIG
jgi:hypothetical protein